MSPRAEVVELDTLGVEDPLALDQSTLDPKLHYRWTSIRLIGRRRLMGYETVLRSESSVRLLQDFGEDSADDRIEVNGMVLMACDKTLFQRRQQRREQQSLSRLGSAQRKAERRIRNSGRSDVLRDDDKER